MCASTIDQPGVKAFNDLGSCLDCTACYTSCMGASDPTCTGAPATMDACDTGTCQSCVSCAGNATCKSQVTACGALPQCVELATKLSTTCTQTK
jgi:hypothetical protein